MFEQLTLDFEEDQEYQIYDYNRGSSFRFTNKNNTGFGNIVLNFDYTKTNITGWVVGKCTDSITFREVKNGILKSTAVIKMSSKLPKSGKYKQLFSDIYTDNAEYVQHLILKSHYFKYPVNWDKADEMLQIFEKVFIDEIELIE